MSTPTVVLPSAKDVTELIHGLLGADVKEVPAPDAELYSIAEFRNDNGETVGYLACDLATGCRLAAGLTCIPPNAADDAASSGTIPDNLAQNLDEIFNICVNLIRGDGTQHVALHEVVHGSDADSFAAHQHAIETGETQVFGFEIERYGIGRLTVSCC